MRTGAGLGILGVTIVGALSCGGGSNAPEAPSTASAFCAQSEALSRARDIQCYGGTAADWPIFFGPSACPTLDQAVAEHRLTYNAAMAPACLAQLAQPVTCSGKWPDDACASVLVGAAATGEPCDSNYVCPQHSNCGVPPDLVDACAAKTCQHIPGLGEKCDFGLCQVGLSCVGGSCVANLKAGDACSDHPDQPFCGENLFCATADPTPTCKPTIENGPCGAGGGCPDYQYCDSTGRCHARLGLGANCASDPTSCQSFTSCDATTHRCVAASHLGQQCGNLTGYPFLCEGGACLTDANQVSHCTLSLGLGDTCAQDWQCGSSYCGKGVCAAPPSNDGAACTKSGPECTSGICSGGFCAAPAADGAACTLPEECMSGLCAGAVCAAKTTNGATCVDGATCVSGHCAAGKCADCP